MALRFPVRIVGLLAATLSACAHPVVAGNMNSGAGEVLECNRGSPGSSPRCQPADGNDPRRSSPLGGRYAGLPPCRMIAFGVADVRSSAPVFFAKCAGETDGKANTWTCATVPAGTAPSTVPDCVSTPGIDPGWTAVPECGGEIPGLRVGPGLLAICPARENPIQ